MSANLCPKCKDVLSIDARACACGWRKSGAKPNDSGPDLFCPWNDRGRTCGERGSMSDALNGAGPWYCSRHYWALKGRTVRELTKPQETFRERWYAERGQPVEPAPQTRAAAAVMPRRQREPGDDDEEVAA